jgi:hypothetical protein
VSIRDNGRLLALDFIEWREAFLRRFNSGKRVGQVTVAWRWIVELAATFLARRSMMLAVVRRAEFADIEPTRLPQSK